MTIQQQFNRYQQIGYPGSLARPNSPHIIERGEAGVSMSPGAGVYFDQTNNDWRLPTSDAERLLVTAVVSYEQGTVQSTRSGGTPSGSNSDQEIVFAADDPIRLATNGDFFVIAGEAMERDDVLVYNQTTGRWIKAPAATADQTASPRKTIQFVGGSQGATSAANGDIVIVRVAHGLNR